MKVYRQNVGGHASECESHGLNLSCQRYLQAISKIVQDQPLVASEWQATDVPIV